VAAAYRQTTDGVRTGQGKDVMYQGKPLKMTPGEGAMRAFGIQPARTADIADMRRGEREMTSQWKDRRDQVLAEYRFGQSVLPIMRFNSDLAKSQAKGLVDPISAQTVRNAGKNMESRKGNAWERNNGY
jgi:hypothetical protein